MKSNKEKRLSRQSLVRQVQKRVIANGESNTRFKFMTDNVWAWLKKNDQRFKNVKLRNNDERTNSESDGEV